MKSSYSVLLAPKPVLPQIQIRTASLIYYELPLEIPKYDRRQNFSGKTYSGKMTEHAAKRIKRAVEVLLFMSPEKTVFNPVTSRHTKFRLTFVTLTISCSTLISHKEAFEKGLKPFLRVARIKFGMQTYIWKAELQKRGQIHYHITTNCFIDYREIKSAWNNIQFRAGWLDEYFAKTGSWAANSTDIHAVHKIKRLDLYLAKYISKSGGQIVGKVWDCSQNLKGKKYFTFEPSAQLLNEIEEDYARGKCKIISRDRCAIVETAHPLDYLPAAEFANWAAWKV